MYFDYFGVQTSDLQLGSEHGILGSHFAAESRLSPMA
eukprot:COSAG06_NODE_598_length_13910_cov_8.818406_7_plen_37_part_00